MARTGIPPRFEVQLVMIAARTGIPPRFEVQLVMIASVYRMTAILATVFPHFGVAIQC